MRISGWLKHCVLFLHNNKQQENRLFLLLSWFAVESLTGISDNGTVTFIYLFDLIRRHLHFLLCFKLSQRSHFVEVNNLITLFKSNKRCCSARYSLHFLELVICFFFIDFFFFLCVLKFDPNIFTFTADKCGLQTWFLNANNRHWPWKKPNQSISTAVQNPKCACGWAADRCVCVSGTPEKRRWENTTWGSMPSPQPESSKWRRPHWEPQGEENVFWQKQKMNLLCFITLLSALGVTIAIRLMLCCMDLVRRNNKCPYFKEELLVLSVNSRSSLALFLPKTFCLFFNLTVEQQ